MSEVRIDYNDLSQAAAMLTAGQAEISEKLETLKSMIDTLIRSEFCGPQALAGFETAYQGWAAKAQEVVGGLGGMSRFVGTVVSRYQDLDRRMVEHAAAPPQPARQDANVWQVLDIEDPTPGDPYQIRALAERLRTEAELFEKHTRQLGLMAETGRGLRVPGDDGAEFHTIMVELRAESARLGVAYGACGDALWAFVDSLEQAKAQASSALNRGTRAAAECKALMNHLCSLLSIPPSDDWRDLSGVIARELRENHSAATQKAAAPLCRDAREAEEEFRQAMTTAMEAARMRTEAEATCLQAIRAAFD